MITITRNLARQFRAAARRAGIGKRPTGRGAYVLIQADSERFGMRTMSDTVAIELSVPGYDGTDQVAVPLDLLAKPELLERRAAVLELVSEALELLNSMKKTQLIVVEAGKPVGVVHFHDLLRAGIA